MTKSAILLICFCLLNSLAAFSDEKDHLNDSGQKGSQRQTSPKQKDLYALPQALFSIRTIEGFQTCRLTPDDIHECLVMYREGKSIRFARVTQMESPFNPGHRFTLNTVPLTSVKIGPVASGRLILLLSEKQKGRGRVFFEVDFSFNPYSVVVRKGDKRTELQEEAGWGEIKISSFHNGFEGWIPQSADLWLQNRIANPAREEEFILNKAYAQELRLRIENWITENNLESHGVRLGPVSKKGYPDNYGGIELIAPGYILLRLRMQFPGIEAVTPRSLSE